MTADTVLSPDDAQFIADVLNLARRVLINSHDPPETRRAVTHPARTAASHLPPTSLANTEHEEEDPSI